MGPHRLSPLIPKPYVRVRKESPSDNMFPLLVIFEMLVTAALLGVNGLPVVMVVVVVVAIPLTVLLGPNGFVEGLAVLLVAPNGLLLGVVVVTVYEPLLTNTELLLTPFVGVAVPFIAFI